MAAKSAQNQLAELMMVERDAVKAMSEWGPEGSKASFESSHVSHSNHKRITTMLYTSIVYISPLLILFWSFSQYYKYLKIRK